MFLDQIHHQHPSAQLGQHQFFDVPNVFNNNVELKHAGDNAEMQQRLNNPHLNHEVPAHQQHPSFRPPPPPPAHHGIIKYENGVIQPPHITLKKPRVTFNSQQVVKLEHEFKLQR